MDHSAEHNDAFHEHDHGECQSRLIEEAETLLKDQGARLTPVRRRTLEILLESHVALGAYEILDRLAESGFGRQPPVAYRALDFLVQHGLAHQLQQLNAFTACLHPSEDHSPIFLICRDCKKIAETHAPEVGAALSGAAGKIGFRVERTTVEALGQCPSCAEQKPQ